MRSLAHQSIRNPVCRTKLNGRGRRRPTVETLEPRCLLAITGLTIQNTLPFARVDEPVTSGVPLPESLGLLDTSQLRILDGAGQPVPAQFRVLGRWNAAPEDTTRPIRWVEVHFAADAPANGTANYELDINGTGNAAAGLQATTSAAFIDVVTGPARFQIDRNNFDLFDTVWLDLNGDGTFADAERIVLPDGENGSFVRQGATEFRSNRELPRSVVLEESGPLRAVVRAEGFHSAANGSDLLRYVTRMTFFAGQSYVQVDHTIIEGRVQGSGNEFGVENQQTTAFDQAGLRVNLELTGAVAASTRGSQATVRGATLNASGTAEIFQRRITDVDQPLSYEVRQNGAAVEAGQRATRAWQDISDSRWGLAVGTRYFWQKNPERLLAESDGTVEVQFPSEPYTIYQAMGLSEDAVFYFHAAGTTTGDFQRVLEGFAKDRLIAAAPPQWMIGSGAFGDLPTGTLAAPFDAFEDFLANSYTATINYINDNHAYGLLNYLDIAEDMFNRPANPDTTSWGNSYYDPGTAWISQFARTGDLTWLNDLAIPYAKHFYTSDSYDTDDPNSYQNGIGGSHGPFHRETWTVEYHYLESLWPYYYLTGDRRALERGLTAAQTYATAPQYEIEFDYGIGSLGPTNRIYAQKFHTMIEAWLATGDASLRPALDNQVAEFLRRRFQPEGFNAFGSEPQPDPYVADQGWMTTHLVHHSIFKYFQLTGNAAAREFVVTAPQRIAEFNRVDRYTGQNDDCTRNGSLFYNNIFVNPDGAGGFTTAPFILDRGPDNCLYPFEVMGLGTALARAGRISNDDALIQQARDLYVAALPQIAGGVWDKDNAKTSLRGFAGLALVAGIDPGPTNQAPVLDPIGNRTVTEGTLLTFTARATDPENDPILYALGVGAPAGTFINPTTGVFSWTPSADQGPGVFDITIRASDNGTPVLSDSETIQVTVNDLPIGNQPPVLDPIGNRSITEGDLLTFTARAVDPNNDPITYSLDAGAPIGSGINANNGVFTFSPSAAQAPGVFAVTIRASDNGNPALSDSETIQITVNETPTELVLPSIADTYLDGRDGGASDAGNGEVDGFLLFQDFAGSDFHPLIRFDLSSAPPASILASAQLTIWHIANEFVNAPLAITIRSLSRDWTEVGSSWINASPGMPWTTSGGDVRPGGIAATIPAFTGQATALTFDVTNIVNPWLTGAETNFGFLIDIDPGQTDIQHLFTTRESANAAMRPTLRLDFEDAAPVNQAPTLAAIGNRTVTEGDLLTFTALATDPDNNSLTYSLDAGAAAGTAINATTGVFTWTPTAEQGPATYNITVRVTDNGTPALDDSETIQVTVNDPPPVLNGEVKGRAFDDLDGNGAFSVGEPLLAGATVFLDADSDGALDDTETRRTVRANGRYRVPQVEPGPRRVCLVPPAGFVAGCADVTVGNGELVTGVALAAFRPARIRGKVTHDDNRNGTTDAGEPALAGVTLFLDTNGNGQLDAGELSRQTNAQGSYRFTNLRPGSYTVVQIAPAGFEQVSPAGGIGVTVPSGGTVRANFRDDQPLPSGAASRSLSRRTESPTTEFSESVQSPYATLLDLLVDELLAREAAITVDGFGT